MTKALSRILGKRPVEGLGGSVSSQPDKEPRVFSSFRHIPVLGLGFPSKPFRHFGGRMNLEAQPLRAIQPFDEEREGEIPWPTRPHHLIRFLPEQFP